MINNLENCYLPTLHLWTIDLDLLSDPLSQFVKILSSQEQKRADLFIYSELRRRWTICAIAKRVILSKYTQLKADEIDFEYGTEGKPKLVTPLHIHFNVSHSEAKAVIGVMDHNEIGVDVEFNKPDDQLLKIADRFFTKQERNQILDQNESYHLTFYKYWTRKEAYIKCVGGGLTIPLDSFAVSNNPKTSDYIMIDNSTKDVDNWSTVTWQDGEYSAAATVNLPPERYHVKHYNSQDLINILNENVDSHTSEK